MPAPETPTPLWGPEIGWIDEPRDEGIVGPQVRIAGWALATRGIRAIEVRLDAHALRARYGLPRPDVASVRPGYPDNPYGGFEFVADLSSFPAPPGVDRRTLAIVAIAADDNEFLLGKRSLVEASAHARWDFLGEPRTSPFYVIPALSGVAAGAAFGLETWYAAYLSRTTGVGMRVPILYLRTTTGPGDDYRFDADFDVERRIGTRRVADDALAPVLAHARTHAIPVLITLNGGIWADAGGTCTEWDLIDHLEENVANCQWNERNEVMPDDYLRGLPGSHDSPELARALTLNVHARTVRAYKKRNLQQAASALVAFMHEHPELFIGVNVDPDVYINPFFLKAQWYDYNPQTVAQFREWLAGTGPYAGEIGEGGPDLSNHRRAVPLSLDEVRAIARRPFARWEDVDPPRVLSSDSANPYWRDPWVREWEMFRRHLVALHYDEIVQWVVEAGIPRERVWSSQGLMAAEWNCLHPIALSIASPVNNHDSGGVTVAGSKPRDGHLGAIVYGAAATNTMPMENGRSLYATLAAIDPAFAIVEFNTADLRRPERRPTYADAYGALRDLWNTGARFVSPMAWNGSNGIHAQDPDYVTYTAWRNTPLEEATRDFLLARSGLPLGNRLWTFGTGAHADTDGWRAEAGAMRSLPRGLALRADDDGRVTLVSPDDIALASDTIAAVVVGLPDGLAVLAIEVETRETSEAPWMPLAYARAPALVRTAAGRLVTLAQPQVAGRVDALRIAISVAPHASFDLARVAILRRRERA